MNVQTLKAIFEGKKELFKNLYIEKETDYDFKKYPVLYFDFSDLKKENGSSFEDRLACHIDRLAEDLNVDIPNTKYVNEKMRRLLYKLSSRDGHVIVLIDNYDQPTISNINQEDFEDIKETINVFFSCLKANSQYLRFVFITGVSRYVPPGIFGGGMDNILNVSLDEDYASILGFTEEEIENNFADYIYKGAKDLGVTRNEYLSKIKDYYFGYRFSLESDIRVYNPLSINSFFTQGEGIRFNDYWMKDGSTDLIMKVARANDFSILATAEMVIDFGTVFSYEVYTLIKYPTTRTILYLMYQKGYLTLKEQNRRGNVYLDFPNTEVRSSFSREIVTAFLSSNNVDPFLIDNILKNLATGKKEEAFKNVNALYGCFSDKSFDRHSTEKDFLNPLIFALNGSTEEGKFSLDEYPVSSDSIGYILCFKNYIYVLEATINKSIKEALDSIIERGHCKQFLSNNEKREVILVGLSFNYDESNQSEMRLLDEPEFLVPEK